MKLGRSGCLAIGISLVAVPVMTGTASAAKAKVPGAPTIVKISTKQVKKKSQNLTVTVERPADTGGSPIIDMTVEVQGKKCTIKKSANACTVKAIPQTVTARPFIYVTARNKAGKSKRVRNTNYTYMMGTWLAEGFTPAGTRFPAANYKRSVSRILPGSSVKLSKFQPIKRSSVSSESVRQRVPSTGAPAVTFTVTGVIGLALPAVSANAPASGMFAVKADGSLVDSLAQGSLAASVRDFYSAPNGRFYVTFTSSTALEQGALPCVLAEVDASTGVPTCVDNSISSVSLVMRGRPGMVSNAAVQFDGQGNIYYSGLRGDRFVLRKWVNGTATSIINDNIMLDDFLVMDDGSVLLSGSTVSPYSSWFRKLSPNSTLSSLLPSGSGIQFMKKFPDGNVYVGVSGGPDANGGIRRYLAATGELEEKYWIMNVSALKTTLNAYFLTGSVCSYPSKNRYCMSSGSFPSKLFTTSDDRVVGVVSGVLVQFYPTLALANSTLASISVAVQVGNKLVLAGTNSVGTNMLTVYDPTTFQETIVTDSQNEVEIYSVAYVASTNKLLFNGLQFNGNQVVLGEVDFAGL